MRRLRLSGVLLGSLLAACVSTAHATPVTWTFSGVTVAGGHTSQGAIAPGQDFSLDVFLDTDRVEMPPSGGLPGSEIGFGSATGVISIAGVPFADATFTDFEYIGGSNFPLPGSHITSIFLRQTMLHGDGGSSVPGLDPSPRLPTNCVWPAPFPPTMASCKLDDGPTVPADTTFSSNFSGSNGVYASSLNPNAPGIVYVTAMVTQFQVPEGGSTALFLILAQIPVAVVFLLLRYKRSAS